jgi:hypothetical protein
MDEELISKKELLELKGISYGQLYRWKRKDLIPEEWFIRKSAVTGQETFFPKARILGRIDKILSMKEDLSLEDLAGMFSSTSTQIRLKPEEIDEMGIASRSTVGLYLKLAPVDGPFTFDQALFLYVLEKMFRSGDINHDEGKDLIPVLEDHYRAFEGKAADLVFLRKLGTPVFLLVSGQSTVFCDNSARIITRLSMQTCIEELKTRIK